MAIREYFPGANTPSGFYSYYSDIFKNDEAENIVVLKGGPGTGKSSLMKKTAAHAAEMGYDVELLHCSSDPDSLDGVCVREKGFLIVDGTSPHVIDPKFPGAVDEIVNLGEFWKAEDIRPLKNEIKKLSESISREFQKAYSYMKAAHSVMTKIRCDFGSDRACVFRELESVRSELGITKLCHGGSVRKAFLSADTHLGRISYAKSFAQNAKHIISVIPDSGNTCAEFMKELAHMLVSGGISVRLFYNNMNPEAEIEHIYAENEGIFITAESVTENCSRIVDFNSPGKTVSGEYDADMNLHTMLMQKTTNVLKNAKKLHDELEKYYIPHMNFDMMDSKLEYIIKKLH